MTRDEKLTAIKEAIDEARRLNAAAGHTVFNPTALAGLRDVAEAIEKEAP